MLLTENNQKDILITGWSGGCGKTKLARTLAALYSTLYGQMISCATRFPRGNEKHGKDYFFIGVEEFITRIRKNEFLEWTRPLFRRFYGSLMSEYRRIKSLEKAAIFELDCNGIEPLRKRFKKDIFIIFLNTPLDVRKKWMEKRGDMTPEEINARIAIAEGKEKLFLNQNEQLIDWVVPYDESVNPDLFAKKIVNFAKFTNDQSRKKTLIY